MVIPLSWAHHDADKAQSTTTATCKDMANLSCFIYHLNDGKLEYCGWESGTKHAHQCTLLHKLLQKEPKSQFGLVNTRVLSIGVTFLGVCSMFSLRVYVYS